MSLVAGVIFVTMGYIFITPAFSLRAGYGSILALMGLAWLVGGAIALGNLWDEGPLKGKEALYAALLYSGVVWVFLGAFAAINLAAVRSSAGENLWAISRYYLALFGIMLGLALVLPRRKEPGRAGRLPWVAAGYGAISYPFLAAAVSLFIYSSNLAVVQADMVYNQGLSYFSKAADFSRRPEYDRKNLIRLFDQAIDLYHRAQRLAPAEDFYYFEETRAIQYKYRNTQEPSGWGPMVERAIEVTRRAHALNPLNTDHVLNMGRLHVDWASASPDPAERARRLQEAVGYYREALRMSPNAAHIHNELAAALAASGDLEGSLASFRRSLELDDRYVDTYLAQARLLLQVGRLPEAEASLDKAVELDADSLEARSARAWVYAQTGRLDQAIAENREVLRLDAKNYSGHQNLILLYERTGRLDEAIAQALAALSIVPASEQPALQVALGNLYLHQGAFAAAESYYKKALALKGDLPLAYKGLGLAYANQGRLPEAVTATLRVLEFMPNDYESRKNLALMYRDLRHPDKALAEARRALDLAPPDQKESISQLIAQLEEG